MASKRQSWIDEQTQEPAIEDKARQLDSFVAAMMDGKIAASEVESQEQRLVAVMKEVEPQLDDALHAKVTELLCELTAYDIMQVLHALHETRPKHVFQG